MFNEDAGEADVNDTWENEHRLRVFENKVLRKIFVAKRDEFTGEWRRLREMNLQGNGERYIMLSYTRCILRLTLLGILDRDD